LQSRKIYRDAPGTERVMADCVIPLQPDLPKDLPTISQAVRAFEAAGH
jgi:hypothetical protein